MSIVANIVEKTGVFAVYFYTLIYSILCIVSSFISFSVKNRLTNLLLHQWASTLRFMGGIKISVEGREYLKNDQPYVLISNHQSIVDIIVLYAITSSVLRMVVKKELLYIPFFGWGLWCLRFIHIDRSNRRKAMRGIDRGARQIKNGTSVLLFPEGTRSIDGNLNRFQAGSFIMAIKSQVPIIPITISGTINIIRKNKPFEINLNREVKVIIAPPINTSQYTIHDRHQLKDIVETIIRNNYEKIRYLSVENSKP